MVNLADAASAFAEGLAAVVNATFASGAAFDVHLHEDKPIAWVWPAGTSFRVQAPIAVASTGNPPKLWIHARFQVRLDDEGEYLAVERSVFSLCINDKGRPAIRIEYDRDAGNEPDASVPGQHARSAAHVQIHGSSQELSYALAMTEQEPRSLETFHVPVGGRRFRPTLEDFVEFLHAERLVPPLNSGWEQVVAESRKLWLERQLRAAVRRDSEIAADQLLKMGWDMSPPPPNEGNEE